MGRPLDGPRLRAALAWVHLIVALGLAVLIGLVRDGPIDWRLWCRTAIGAGCVLALGLHLSTAPRSWAEARSWWAIAIYAAYPIAAVAAYCAHPSAAGVDALFDLVLFVAVIGCVAQAQWPGRLLSAILAMLCLIGLQVLGPVSVVIAMGRATHYKSVDQWGGYPEIGMLMAIGAAACIALFFASRRWALRGALALLALGLAGTTAYMLSRSAMLTIVAVAPWLTIVAAWRWRSRLALVTLAILILATLAVGLRMGTTAWARLVAATQVKGAELDLRRDGWNAGAAMLRDHPWLGVGPGRYADEHARYSTLPDRAHAYNLVLHTGAEVGLIGLTAYLAIWGRLLLRTLRASGPTPRGLVAFAAHAMLLAFFLRSQSEHFLANLPASGRMLLFLGFLIGLAEAATRAQAVSDRA